MSVYVSRQTNNAGSAAQGSTEAVPGTVVQRDDSGGASFTSVTVTTQPTNNTDVATKGYVDNALGGNLDHLSVGKLDVDVFNLPDGAASGAVLTSDATGNGTWQNPTSLATPSTLVKRDANGNAIFTALTVGKVTTSNVASSGPITATGSITTQGNLVVNGTANTGALTANSLTTNGALTAGSATVTNALSAGSLQTGGTLYVSGAANVGSLGVSGALTADSVTTSSIAPTVAGQFMPLSSNCTIASNTYALPLSSTTSNTMQVLSVVAAGTTSLTMDVVLSGQGFSQSLQYVVPVNYSQSTAWFRLTPKANASWFGESTYVNSSTSSNATVTPWVNFDIKLSGLDYVVRMVRTTPYNNVAGTATINYRLTGSLTTSTVLSTTAGALVTDTTIPSFYAVATELAGTAPVSVGGNMSVAGTLTTASTLTAANITTAGTLTAGTASLNNVNIGSNQTVKFTKESAIRKLILYNSDSSNSSSSHIFYGMGIDSNTLRYQVDNAGSSHVFFAATSATTSKELFRIAPNGNVSMDGTLTAGNITTAGTLTVGSITTTNGLPNYYQEYTFTTNMSGAWSASNVTFYLTRIGRSVTISSTTGSYCNSKSGAFAIVNSTTSVPNQFIPGSETAMVILGTSTLPDGSIASVPLQLGVSSTGLIRVLNNYAGDSGWLNTRAASFSGFSATYHLV